MEPARTRRQLTLRQKRRRGSILLLALFFMILLSLLAVAFMKLVPAELQAAARHHRDTASYYTADAGIVEAIAFLRKETLAGIVDEAFEDGPRTHTGTLGEWGWECTITPDNFTYGSGTVAPNPLRAYRLDCVALLHPGTLTEQKYREVTVWILQDSFASEAYVVDNLPATIWLNLATFRLEGNYMTNDQLLLYTTGSGFSWDESNPDVRASFEGHLKFFEDNSSTPDGATYNSYSAGNIPYDSSTGAPIPARYRRIATAGRAGIQKMDEKFKMPEGSEDVARGAFGSDPPSGTLSHTSATHLFGTSNSVNAHVDAAAGGDLNAGIYIEGDIRRLEFRVDGGQLMEVNPVTGSASTVSSSDSDYQTWVNSKGTVQPEGHIIQGGNQVAEIRQGSGSSARRLDVAFISEADVVIPAGATLNGQVLTQPRTLRGTDNDGQGYTLFRNSSQNVSQDITYAGTLPVGTYKLYNEQSNGVIYATGDVNGVRGVVKGRRTVAVDSSASAEKVVRVNGHLTYADTTPWSLDDFEGANPDPEDLDEPFRDGHPDPNRNPETLSQLGLIGYAVRVKSQQGTGPNDDGMWPSRTQTGADNPLYIYASIFAGRADDDSTSMTNGGGFGTESYDLFGLGKGRMEIYGSITEGVRQAKGLIDYSGYDYSYFYDDSLRRVQPPYFPSLPSYRALSWEEKSSFNY